MAKTLQSPSARDSSPVRLARLAPVALIVLVGCVAYWNSLKGAFVFDDVPLIEQNPTLRSLWPPGAVLSPPPGGSPVTGRPLVNLSLAVNYALGGTQPWGYHVVNLAVHILAGIALFGIIRRTLMLPRLREQFVGRSAGLALAVAVIWLAHPLQTESVTYVCQRAESLAGLLYLAAVYCCVRAFQADRGLRWKIAGVALCLAGMATKETVATLPVVVLLYDRTFLSRSLREAMRRRWGMYSSLAATWALLAVLVFQTGNRGGTAGFGQGITSWEYARTQFGAIVHYLRLCVWPNPLILDYGTGLATGARQVVPYAIVVIGLLTATVLSMRYLPWAGFLGACFFLLLAPSSSFVPVATQTLAEHRMYLPLAAVIVTVVMVADWAWGRLVSPVASVGGLRAAARWAIPVAVVGALVAGETYLTILRNDDYRSDLAIWQDTVQNAPSNTRARTSLGVALMSRGQVAQAIQQYRQVLACKPDDPEAHNNLGVALDSQGQTAQAIMEYEQALKARPGFAEAHYNLGTVLASQGHIAEAIEHYRQALETEPGIAQVHNNLGVLLAERGEFDEAIWHIERALQLRPDYAVARENLNRTLAQRRATAPAPDTPARP